MPPIATVHNVQIEFPHLTPLQFADICRRLGIAITGESRDSAITYVGDVRIIFESDHLLRLTGLNGSAIARLQQQLTEAANQARAEVALLAQSQPRQTTLWA